MVYQFTYRRRVEFSDTDMAGIMHFSRYFVFMESAEHAFFRSLGHSIHAQINGITYGWPRIEAQCHYTQPLHFEDEVEIHLRIREISQKTIHYDVTFHKLQEKQSQEVAQGSLKVICVSMDETTHHMQAVPIPDEIRCCIQPAPGTSP